MAEWCSFIISPTYWSPWEQDSLLKDKYTNYILYDHGDSISCLDIADPKADLLINDVTRLGSIIFYLRNWLESN